MKNYEITDKYLFRNLDLFDDSPYEPFFKIVIILFFNISYVLLWFTIPFNFLIIHLLIYLYLVTDKKVYEILINNEIIPKWYLEWKSKKINENIRKYGFKNKFTIVKEIHKSISGFTDKRIKTRRGTILLYTSPFCNCQTFCIGNFKVILSFEEKWLEVVKFSESKNKKQVVIDINSSTLSSFKAFAKKNKLRSIQYMEYTSTNGSIMVLIKFVI